MLETTPKYRKVYETLKQGDPQYIHEPSTKDWKVAKKLCVVEGEERVRQTVFNW
jgi:hypothetical protein